MKASIAIVLILFGLGYAAQSTTTDFAPVELFSDSLPKVFLLGEYEEEFDKLTLSHQTLLMTACNDDMDVAFGKWISMVHEMEAFSNLIGYDLDGIKMWLNVFWNENGSISHVAYFLKPNSKNVDTIELTRFLSQFVKNYRFPHSYKRKFSHYGTANFPSMPKRVKKVLKEEEKNKDANGKVKSGD